MRLGVLIVLVMAACGSGESTPSSTPTASATTSTSTTTTVSSDGRPSDAQIGIFVANLIETLGSETYAVAIEEDPLPFVTSGALMCELLSSGSSPTQVLDQFLASFGPAPSDADSALAGALLGSAVNAFCPQHRQLLQENLG